MQKLISYYPDGIMLKKGINNYPEKYIDFNDLIKIMKSDNLKIQINNLRKFEYKSYDYNYYKKRLPVVLFNKLNGGQSIATLAKGPLQFDYDDPSIQSFVEMLEQGHKNFEKQAEEVANKQIALYLSK